MPGMNGLEMVSRMVKQSPDIQVLYISDSKVLAAELSGKGEVPFLEKPFSMGALSLTAQQLLNLGIEGKAANKRKYIRIPMSWTASFSSQKYSGEGQVIDLSMKGCSIETHVKIPKNTELSMKISPPLHGVSVPIDVARVQWSTTKKFGVEFLKINEQGRVRLRRAVGTLLSQSVDLDKED